MLCWFSVVIINFNLFVNLRYFLLFLIVYTLSDTFRLYRANFVLLFFAQNAQLFLIENLTPTLCYLFSIKFIMHVVRTILYYIVV